MYLNLASRLTLSGINQLWVADSTYIRLKGEFVYLAVMLDAYSRKVVGWALDRTLAARLPIAALAHALAERYPPPGLVHHSDRGVLGGFKWSSQHLDEGGCDEHSKA
ncbi:MAG: DDE-type integrase/transposase/recombinase, partial [Nitrospirota bacterium]